jgi:hypothetical protein
MNLLNARKIVGDKNTAISVVFAALFTLMAGDAMANPKHSKPHRDCGLSFEKAKESFEASHLMEAKALLEKCIRAVCGSMVHNECTSLYSRLQTDVPTIVPMVTDAVGTPRTHVEVKMDGEVLTSKLDGLGLPVEPGTHEFSFDMGDGVFAKRRIMIAQGQHNRPISVVLRATRGRSPSDLEPARAGVAHERVARKPVDSVVAESETTRSAVRAPKDPPRIGRHRGSDRRL